MRFFLLAAIPLVLSVLVQMSIGLNKVKVIALAALAGSVVNLPISCFLTARLGVPGVIWGTVLTTLFSNLLVPGIYVFRELQIDPRHVPEANAECPVWPERLPWSRRRGLLRSVMPVTYPGTALWSRSLPLIRASLTVGYAGVRWRVSHDARSAALDAAELAGKLLRRVGRLTCLSWARDRVSSGLSGARCCITAGSHARAETRS